MAGTLSPRSSAGGNSTKDSMATSGASDFVRGHIQANTKGKPHAATFKALQPSGQESEPNAQTVPVSEGSKNAKTITLSTPPGTGQGGYYNPSGGR
jgi:hypothetical protein